MTTAVVETPPATPPATPPVETPPSTPPVVATTPPEPPAANAPPVVPVPPEAELKPTPPETYTLTLPEHAPFDESVLESLTAEATALGLSQAQFDTLVAHHATTQIAFAARLKADLEADPVLGGAHLADTEKHAVAGLEAIFPRGTPGNDLIRTFLNQTGFGNHPEIIREFVRIGKARAEDRPFLGHRTDPIERKPIEQVMYPTMATT